MLIYVYIGLWAVAQTYRILSPIKRCTTDVNVLKEYLDML